MGRIRLSGHHSVAESSTDGCGGRIRTRRGVLARSHGAARECRPSTPTTWPAKLASRVRAVPAEGKVRPRKRKRTAMGVRADMDALGNRKQRGVQRGIADADKIARTGSRDESVRDTPPAGAWNDVSGD
jgi:hypothetical protein